MSPSAFDSERVTALVKSIGELHIPEAANRVVWVTIDYVRYLKSDPEQDESWTPERQRRERDTANEFVELVTEPNAWKLAKQVAPELEVGCGTDKVPPLLAHVLKNIKSKAPRRPDNAWPTNDGILEWEQALRASVLEERVRFVAAMAGQGSGSRTDEMVQTLEKSRRAKETSGGATNNQKNTDESKYSKDTQDLEGSEDLEDLKELEELEDLKNSEDLEDLQKLKDFDEWEDMYA
ncbi:hypothetical protein PV08_07180 [Exophiala spinifera]|uniref:Uncharacterized protein n=1 Tax=Exophiala spinifera TaxID=91928 RepID=A0A0D2B689_9EURO|nr:uncharacterized protein PV08_07180 [Exophiala spinifera]KIW14398.1 hypothetical protein PV08_07180 [Exophiala spinifera]